MMTRFVHCILAAAFALAGLDAAMAQPRKVDAGAAATAAPRSSAATLTAAVARASGGPGWRTETLADGRAIAIGIGVSADAVHVVGIACGLRGRPEIAADARGPASLPRALLVETEESVMAFPIDPEGAPGFGVDALTTDIMFTDDRAVRMWLDARAFPTNGARQALASVEKDCAARFGWQYGNDHEQQLVWAFWNQSDRAPNLVFGKPWTGWIMAGLSCNRTSKELRVDSTGLPRGAKHGQSAPLVIEIDGRKLSITARTELQDGGDVAGYLVARFRQPRQLLDLLRDAKEIKLQTKSATLIVPARGVGPLLGRFETACGFK